MRPVNIFKVIFTSILASFLITYIGIGLPIYIFGKIFPKYDFFDLIPFPFIFIFFLIIGLIKNFVDIKDEEIEKEEKERRYKRNEFFEKD